MTRKYSGLVKNAHLKPAPPTSFESARPLDSLDFSFFLSLSLLIYKTESKLRDEKGLSQTRFLNEQPRFILHLVGT